jgi:hypothetical protein
MSIKNIILSEEASQKKPHIIWFNSYKIQEAGWYLLRDRRAIEDGTGD